MGGKRKRVVRSWSSDELSTRGRRPSQELDTSSDEMPFVQIAKAAVGVIHDAIQRIGNAVIGPDQTGNARGANAFDLQAERSQVTQVASGDGAIAVGVNNTASGLGAIAVGSGNTATGITSVAFGADNIASAELALAFGSACEVTADRAVGIGYGALIDAADGLAFGANCEVHAASSTALGRNAIARIANTVAVGGVHILRLGSTAMASSWFHTLSAVEVVLSSAELDLKSVDDYIITLPAGCHFFLSECGLLLTALTALTTQPTIRFGVSGSLAASLAAFLCTDLSVVGARERFLPDNRAAGVTSLSFGVTSAAVATVLKGRAYWKGVLVEDEV